MGSDVRAAITGLRETSGPLAGPERLALGAGELSSLVAAKRGGAPAGELRYRSLSTPIAPSAPTPAESRNVNLLISSTRCTAASGRMVETN